MPPPVLAGLKGGVAYFNEAAVQPFGKQFIDLSDEGVAYLKVDKKRYAEVS